MLHNVYSVSVCTMDTINNLFHWCCLDLIVVLVSIVLFRSDCTVVHSCFPYNLYLCVIVLAYYYSNMLSWCYIIIFLYDCVIMNLNYEIQDTE